MIGGCSLIGRQTTNVTRWFVGLALFSIWIVWPSLARAEGAVLKITPASGTYEVGGLVDVSFVIDTGGQTINAVQADVMFPADKLQVVNPVASTSFISLWVTAPSYSNTDGTLSFQGGLPTPGIKTSGGVISTVTFRIKSAGTATIRYAPTSRALLNDGNGTNILASSGTADFTLKIPPPAGPIVSSPTHPDSNTWFNNPQIQFQWQGVDGAVGYSYTFDQSPKSVPGDTVNTTSTAVSVKATADGVWYFHVRALAVGWGGVTTIPVQIDATAPAGFQPKFDQSTVTVEEAPILRFVTTDAASGIDHYEIQQLDLSSGNQQSTLFVEAASPAALAKLPAGNYQYVVRAFDRAGNSIDASTKLTVVAAGVTFFARVPLLRNPAVANIALIAMGVLALALVSIIIIRRVRLRSTFQHDLAALEKDAMKKTHALERELQELRQAQTIINSDFSNTAPPPSVPPSVSPLAPTPAVPPPPISSTQSPESPYHYQPPTPPI